MVNARVVFGIILLIGAFLAAASAYTTWQKLRLSEEYNELGLKAMEDGDYDKAIEYFTMAIDVNPSYAIAYYNRGNAYGNEEQFHRYYKLPGQTFVEAGFPEMQENYESALRDFEKSMELDKNLVALAEFGIGNINFLYYCGYENREKEVLPHYFKALENKDKILAYSGKEGLAALYANIARTYLAMAELDRAYEYYKMSIETFPIDTAYEHLAWVEVELGNFEDAYKIARDYLKHEDWETDLGLMPAAISAYHLGKFDEAERYCMEIIEKFPDSAYLGEAHRILALIYQLEGKHDMILKELEEDVEVCSEVIKNPEVVGDLPGAYYERGVAYFLLGKFNDSIEDFKWIIENPRITKREVAHENYYLEAHVGLACAYSKIGKFDESLKVLGKISTEIENPEFKGWKKLVGNLIEKLRKEISKGASVDIPLMFSELSH